MSAPDLVDVEHNATISFYVYRYSDGSVQIRKPHDSEVARQHGIHTINLTREERTALARILAREAKPLGQKELPMMRNSDLCIVPRNDRPGAGVADGEGVDRYRLIR